MKHFLWITLWFVIMVAIGGLAVMLLWNWLMPEITGWAALSYWQSVGLLALARILVGGLHPHHHGHDHRGHHDHHDRMAQRWRTMTDEDKEAFLARRRRFWGDRLTNHWCDELDREAQQTAAKTE